MIIAFRILICFFLTLLVFSCTSGPVGLTEDINVIDKTNNQKEDFISSKKLNNDEIQNYYDYYDNGCLIKCWDYDDLNPVWTYWAAWSFIKIDEWGGKNYQCKNIVGECEEWSWRAVYCGIINPQNNPTPEYTCDVAYIQTLMSQAGQTFVGELSQWSYEEIYVQPHYQFPTGTSQINIDFVNLVDYE